MRTWSKIVEFFPLTVEHIWRQYTRRPTDAPGVYYHYTTHAGMDGILRTGGLHATHRMRMNDTGELDYARNVIYETLNEVKKRHNLPAVAQSLTTYTRTNLDHFLKNTIVTSRAYCACLTVSSDHPKQWELYAEKGKGFAIGFNLLKILNNQASALQRGDPYILGAPVTYDENEQHDLVWRSVKAGIRDMQTFRDTCSQKPEDLAALRDRVTQEIVVQLLSLIDFIKAPSYTSEREFRLILEPNDGTLNAPNIQYYEHHNESIPYIFMDLRTPETRRLPLAEIVVGPKASFTKEKAFLEDLLDELDYGVNYEDRPRIRTQYI